MFLYYCDESCHLENDESDVMVLGTIKCDSLEKDNIYEDIREIKEKHGMNRYVEVKWNKVSNNKYEFYSDLIDYFFDNENLFFRGVIAQNKNKLDIYRFFDSYDEWYYRIYYILFNKYINILNTHKIFLDIKDTKGGAKVRKLHDVISNTYWDFNKTIIKDIRLIDSKESELIQLTDILIGALSYFHRNYYDPTLVNAKSKIISKIIDRSSKDLKTSTDLKEEKFNFFIWKPDTMRGDYNE